MNAKDIVRELEKAGWFEVKGRGSHRNFKHPEQPGKVTIPMAGGGDLPKGTVRSIEKQSGLSLLRRN